MKKIHILSVACIVLVSACQKELEFEGYTTTPEIVVNSVFSSDNLWNIEVSKSKNLLSDQDYEYVDDAKVMISNAHGWAEELTNSGDGVYTSKYNKPRSGVEYSIRVEDQEGNVSSALNSIPLPVKIKDIKEETYISSDGRERYKIYMSFQDPVGENYYSISFYYLNILANLSDILVDGPTDTSYGVIPVPTLYVNDPDLRSVVKINSGFNVDKGQNWYTSIKGLYFTDEFFDGQYVTLEFEMDPEDVDEFLESTGGTLMSTYIFYSLSFLSRDYFMYNSTLDKQVSSASDPTAQPVKVYSNIHNGMGIFAGYSTVSDSIRINQ